MTVEFRPLPAATGAHQQLCHRLVQAPVDAMVTDETPASLSQQAKAFRLSWPW